MKFVQKTIVSEPKYTYSFEFDEKELGLIMLYLGRTGGCPTTSDRKIADGILQTIVESIPGDERACIRRYTDSFRNHLENPNNSNFFFKGKK